MSNKHSHAKNASDSSSLIESAVDMAGEAGNRLKAVFDNSKEFVANVRDKAVAGAKATDKAVQKHPYKFVAVAAGVGLLLGFFMARRHGSNERDDQE